MLCDICHKNIATVHLTEIVNDNVVEMHICQNCAHSKAQELSGQLNVSDFLSGFIGVEPKSSEHLAECSKCGLSYEEFRKRGRLGCAHCYVTFRKHLLPLLKKIHSSIRHAGKVPLGLDKKAANELDIKELRKLLDRAIQLEEYEEAAKLRDEIKKLQKSDQRQKTKD